MIDSIGTRVCTLEENEECMRFISMYLTDHVSVLTCTLLQIIILMKTTMKER